MENEMIKVTSIWDSTAEKKAFDILEKIINKEYYQISKHISLKEIFKNREKKPWMNWHIDFLVEDSEGYPVLGIEINGSNHWNKAKCRQTDKDKKVLFAKAGIPLVCIPLPEIPSYTKEEYKAEYLISLQELMEKYLFPYYHRTSYPVYCRKCGHKFAYMFRNDHEGAFYCCLNQKCDFKTISADKLPLMFK